MLGKKVIKSVWETIPKKEQNTLRKFTILQSSLSSLDLITVLLLGSSATIAYRTVTKDYKPSKIELLISNFFHTNPNSIQVLLVLSILSIITLITKNLLGMFFSYKFLYTLSNLELKLSTKAFTNFIRSKPKIVYDLTPAEFQWMISTAPNRIISGFILPINNLFADLVSTFFLVTFAFLVSPVTTFVISFFSILFFLVYNRFIGIRTTKYGFISKSESIDLNNLTTSIFSGFKEVKIYGITKKIIQQFSAKRQIIANLSQKVQWINSLFKYVSELIIVIAGTLIMIIEIARTDLRHSITTLVIFLAIGFRLIPISQRLQAAFNSIRISSGMIDSFLKFNSILNKNINEIDFQDEQFEKEILTNESGVEVIFEDVTYEVENKTILQNVNLHIPAGECILIVGESGAGKTTIIDLIMGLNNPTHGNITLKQNGKMIDVKKSIFCGYSTQIPLIVEGTLENNIKFFNSENINLTKSNLIEKLNLTELNQLQNRTASENFIEKNNDFSGGEKIRIGVARTILSNKPLLIFDEPTNSLDFQNRKKVIDSIREFSTNHNSTIFIVAHNPEEFDFASKIINIKNANVDVSII